MKNENSTGGKSSNTMKEIPPIPKDPSNPEKGRKTSVSPSNASEDETNQKVWWDFNSGGQLYEDYNTSSKKYRKVPHSLPKVINAESDRDTALDLPRPIPDGTYNTVWDFDTGEPAYEEVSKMATKQASDVCAQSTASLVKYGSWVDFNTGEIDASPPKTAPAAFDDEDPDHNQLYERISSTKNKNTAVEVKK